MVLVSELAVLVVCMTGCSPLGGGRPGEDTDGDGITDHDEREVYGTDPLLADSDGDGLDDKYEVDDPGVSPLLAELPVLQFSVDQSGASIVLNYLVEETQERATETAECTASARTDTRHHQTSTEHFTKQTEEVSAEMSYSSTGGVSGSVSGSASFEESTTTMNESAWGSESTSSSEQAMTEAASHEETYLADSGTMIVNFTVRNTGSRAVRIENLTIAAKLRDRSDPALRRAIAMLSPADGHADSLRLDVGETGEFAAEDPEIAYSLAKSAVAFPQGLVFSVGDYDLVDGTPLGIDYALVSSQSASRTSLITIDYGNAIVDVFAAATGATRDDSGNPVGMSVAEILALVSAARTEGPDEISLTTAQLPDGTVSVESITRDGVVYANEANSAGDGFAAKWIWTSSAANASTITSFDDLVLKPRNVLRLIYVEDRDGDGLVRHLEDLYGCSDDPNATDVADPTDSDGDTIGDNDEVVGTNRYVTNPASADTDGDGTPDNVEISGGTDPTVNEAEIPPAGVTIFANPGGSTDNPAEQITVDDFDLSDNHLPDGSSLTWDNNIAKIEPAPGWGLILFEDADPTTHCRALYVGPESASVDARLDDGVSVLTRLDTLSDYDFADITSAIKLFDPSSWDLETDVDADGLPDAVETYINSTWSLGPGSGWSKYQSIDTNGDGNNDGDEDGDYLKDWWELLFDLNPGDAHTGGDDRYLDTNENCCFLENLAPDGYYLFTDPSYGGYFVQFRDHGTERKIDFQDHPHVWSGFHDAVSSVRRLADHQKGFAYVYPDTNLNGRPGLILTDYPTLGSFDNTIDGITINCVE